VENETRKTVKTLRTDHSGEYCLTEFEVFCADHDIQRELIAV